MPESDRVFLVSLRKRAEFLAVRGGAKWVTPAFVLEAKSRPASPGIDPSPRFGLTVTKKLGSAVVRNRIRRRLKEALRTGAANEARPGFDYVVIARAPALMRPFEELMADFRLALAKVHRQAKPGA